MGEIMGNVSGGAGGALGIARSARPWRLSLAALIVLLAALLLHGASAQAFSQRGHEFAGSFGESGEPAKPSKPSAIAVNETSGDVYVLESANNRVVVYGPAHEFLETWGYGVSNGEKVLQQCKEQAKCLPGLAGFGKEGELDAPPAIAVDNSGGSSNGDVYVVANRTWKKASIFKFTPNGELLGNLITKAEKEEEIEEVIRGVAVDQSGTVVGRHAKTSKKNSALERYDGTALSGRTIEAAGRIRDRRRNRSSAERIHQYVGTRSRKKSPSSKGRLRGTRNRKRPAPGAARIRGRLRRGLLPDVRALRPRPRRTRRTQGRTPAPRNA